MQAGRFATDTSLAAFARRMRVLGYDVRVIPNATLERVCAAAAVDRRVVLTLSRRVPRGCAHAERRIIERGREDEALRSLVAEYRPDTQAFGRCTHCNAVLGPPGAPESLAHAPVPPPADVRVTGQCPDCRRCYWHGSHVDRLRAWLGRVLGCDLAAP
jgi:uncharacterized protein